MSVWWRRRAPVAPERRAAFIPPTGPLFFDSGTFGAVDLSAAESSLQKVAIWACVNWIIDKCVTLPVDFYTGTGDDQRQIAGPSWLEDPAGDGYGWPDWLAQLLYSALLRGNVVGLRGDPDPRTGLPRVLPLVHPDCATGRKDRDTGLPIWQIDGREVERDKVWHQRRYVAPGSLMGLSPIGQHTLTIGVGISAMRFGAQWFQDGAHPSGLLTNEEAQLTQREAKTAKERFLAAIRGTREPVVLGRGWKFQQLQIAPEESQFLETNNYTGAECCRIFGPHLAQILGYATADSLTYSNRVDIQTNLATDTLDPWLTWVERLVSRSLMPRAQYMKFNRNALARADLDARFAAYKTAIEGGWMTVDEVRALEDFPKLTDAQKAEIKAMKTPPPAANPEPAAVQANAQPIRVRAITGPPTNHPEYAMGEQ